MVSYTIIKKKKKKTGKRNRIKSPSEWMDVETQNLREFNPREKFSGVNIAVPFTRIKGCSEP